MLRLLALLLALSPSLQQPTVLTHATVIDGTGRPAIPDAAIVIANGVIQEIGPASEVAIPPGAEVVDLTGKTIMPGIINLHGHVGMVKGLSMDAKNYTRENVEDQLRTYAMYGVTTTTSLGTDTDLVLEVRYDQRRGNPDGARIYTALQGFTCLSGYPTHVPGVKGLAQEVGSDAEARARVDELAEKGADMVKMWVDDHHDTFTKLPPATYSAIIDQAHKRGLKAYAHVYDLSDAKGLVDAGIDVLAHSVRDADVDQELIEKMKQNNVTLVPTLTREQSTFIYADPPSWLDDPFFQQGTTPEIIQAVKTTLKDAQAKDPEAEVNRKGFEIAMRNLKKLADAGVRIGFGSDSGPPARFQGFFEHWEMELMVQAGLTPMQVIQAFSKNSAEALGISEEFGTLTKGKVADLVVLDKNPLEDIRNTQTIHAVYLGGERLSLKN